jgi:hypothetical protein
MDPARARPIAVFRGGSVIRRRWLYVRVSPKVQIRYGRFDRLSATWSEMYDQGPRC